MTVRNLIKAAENVLCLNKRCFMISKNSWNAESYFGSKNAIPAPPKKPLSAYMLFIKENRKDILKEDPSLSPPEQIKVLAKKWSHLTEDMKKPYELNARQSIVLYGQEHKKFYENLTEEQKKELCYQKSKQLELRRSLRLKRELRASGLPKLPSSAYNLFVQAEATTRPHDLHPNKFLRRVAEVWKSLSEDSKKAYEIQAVEAKEQYLEDVKQWRERMILEGKAKLLQAYDDTKKKDKSKDSGEVPAEKKKGTLKSSKDAPVDSKK